MTFTTTASDIDQPDLHRSEPSSRAFLQGEHPLLNHHPTESGKN